MEDIRILDEEIDYYFSKFQQLNDEEKEHLKYLIEERRKMGGN